MNVLHFDEVDDSQMTELMLACFDHAYSKDHIENLVSSDKRMPSWGGELYAEEDGRLLGCVGMLYPRAKISREVRKVGGIRNVCSRPSESRSGFIKELLQKAHKRMEEKVDISFLMTSKSTVAYNLYKKLGYDTVHVPPKAYKEVVERDTEIEFSDEADPEYMRSLYTDSVESLSGLVVREEDFFDMAEARGWPDNDNVKTAYKDGERIGYAMYETSRNSLSVKEFAAEKGEETDLLHAFEAESERDYIVLSYVNPFYRGLLEDMGYSWHQDLWYRVMVKDLNDGQNILSEEDRANFHAGIYETY